MTHGIFLMVSLVHGAQHLLKPISVAKLIAAAALNLAPFRCSLCLQRVRVGAGVAGTVCAQLSALWCLQMLLS